MKNTDNFKALLPDVFALWQELSSQHPIPAAQSARRFIDKMTGTMFFEGWELQFQRHSTVSPPNSGAQLQPQLAEAEDEIVERLVRFVVDPRKNRLDLAVQACERFLREMDMDLPAKQRVDVVQENAVAISKDRDDSKSPPDWLFYLAKEVRTLVRSAEGMERFRGMIRTWAREVADWHSSASMGSLEGVPVEPLPYDDGIDLIPIPDRVLTLAEKYAALGAVHDVYWKGEKIDPWHPVPPFPPREARRYAVLLSRFQWPTVHSLPDAGEWIIPDHDEHFLKEFLEDVRHDLEMHNRQIRSDAGVSAGSGQMILPVPTIERMAERDLPVDVSEEPAMPTAFSGGTMVFFEDRVELCGAVICGQQRSGKARKALDCLRKKQTTGRFVALSGEEFAVMLDLGGGQNSVAGLIRDLRDRIRDGLRAEVNIECGPEDVILSRGTGYRLNESISVQDGDEGGGGLDQGHETSGTEADDPDRDTDRDTDGDPNDPNRDDPDDTNDPDGAAATRRSWILQQLAAGQPLSGPEVARQLKCSLATAKRDLQALKDADKIEFVGASRTGYYRLKTSPGQADA